MNIFAWLKDVARGSDQPVVPAENESVQAIVGALGQLDPERARTIACLAFLLGRVAQVDLAITATEIAEIEGILALDIGLPVEQANLVARMALQRAQLFGGTDNFLVSRELNELIDRPRKIALVRCLFRVAAADETISTLEDNEISQIASELFLDRSEVSSIRAEFRDFLAVLRRPD